MKRPLAILIPALISGCLGAPVSKPSQDTETPRCADPVLTAAAFNRIKDYILAYGDRQTYCNMFNNNPHVALGNTDIYLNPDTGQKNINCDLKLSGFNKMVIRTQNPMKYYRFDLNLKGAGPELLLHEDTDPKELDEILRAVLSQLKEKTGNPTR